MENKDFGTLNFERADTGEEVMTIVMVAVFLRMSRQQVHSLIKSGGLPSIKKGRNRRILKSSLLEWLKKDEQ